MTDDPKKIDPAAPETMAEEAKISPTTVFDEPHDVVTCDDLTKKEKASILKQWEADAKALQRATDEGMSGGTRPGLEEVKHAQGELEKKTAGN